MSESVLLTPGGLSALISTHEWRSTSSEALSNQRVDHQDVTLTAVPRCSSAA